MFFVLSKLLHILVMPIFWIVLFWLLFAWKRHAKWRKKLFYLALTVSFIFTNTVVFKEFVRLWEVQGKKKDLMQTYDVAVVLGGMFDYNGDLETLSVRRGGDRIWQTLGLYFRGKVKKILISGSHGFLSSRGLDEANQLKSELLVWGIPEEDIWIDSVSKNTHENAIESVKILRKKNLGQGKVLLVTSGTHMKRAKACFGKQGLKVSCFSTDLFTGPNRSYHWDEYLIPSISTADDWSILTHEWVGFAIYKVMGYIE